jgi:hypothetical protein
MGKPENETDQTQDPTHKEQAQNNGKNAKDEAGDRKTHLISSRGDAGTCFLVQDGPPLIDLRVWDIPGDPHHP